jgi:hypothetical protein
MKWGTRERQKIDRIACPSLVARFVDPAAELLFFSDHHEMLRHGMVMYDALYTWCARPLAGLRGAPTAA